MIKKTLYFLLTLSSIFSFRAGAQNEIDALRYSTYNLTGSAKFSSMGEHLEHWVVNFRH